jgi:DNA polymerase-3 subunit gamma/tau
MASVEATTLSLARKWRPQRFADVVGQEPAVRVLQNALGRGRLHPVLLFTGVRGVGKTTLARLVAKALNCERGVTAEPCNECSACRALEAGCFVDFLEIDAASRTRVEETRELLANVPYAPANGRFRVYLIDEVHMLSGHSFNALLKTLEEPPAHVVFILATTDPDRVPPTVLSRCLRLSLRRVSPEACRARLGRILDAEGVRYDEESLRLVTQTAEGSLRDALSLVDQAIAYGAGTLRGEEMAALLGTIDEARLLALLLDIEEERTEEVRAFLAFVEERGLDPHALVARLLALLSRIALAQLTPPPAAAAPEWVRAVRALAPETVQVFYEIACKAYEELRVCDDPRTVLRMAVVRMVALRPLALSVGNGEASAPPSPPEPRTARRATRAPERSARASPPASAPPPARTPSPVVSSPVGSAAAPAEAPPSTDPPCPLAAETWLEAVPRLPLQGVAREAAANLGWRRLEAEGRVVLGVARLHADLLVRGTEETILRALRSWDPRVRDLRIEVVEDADFPTYALLRRRSEENARAERETAFRDDPLVQEMVQNWGASIRTETVRDPEESAP